MAGQGKALGIVTTADVEDATQAAFGWHTQDRGAGTGICDMFLDETVANSNLRVLMGGGRKWFLPSGTLYRGRVNNTTTASGADYVLPLELATGWGVPVGQTEASRNLIAAFQSAGFTYASSTPATWTWPWTKSPDAAAVGAVARLPGPAHAG